MKHRNTRRSQGRIRKRLAVAAACLAMTLLAPWGFLPPASASGPGQPILDAPEGAATAVDGPVTAFAEARDGSMVVGSNRLSVYDGAAWQRVAVPKGAYAFRGLAAAVPNGKSPAASAARMWVGGVNAVGYVEKDTEGVWRYVSMRDELTKGEVGNTGDIWHVQATADGAVFVGTTQVLRWDGAAFKTWNLPCAPRLFAFETPADGAPGSTLWLYQQGVGLLKMEKAGPRLALPESSLPAPPPLIGLVPVAGKGDLVVFSESAWIHSGEHWTRLEAASAMLKGRLAIGACRLDDRDVAIGTFSGGAVILDTDSGNVTLIDGRSGLPDDSLDTVWSNGKGVLWMGLGTGIARLRGSGAVSMYEKPQGPSNGSAIKVVEHEGRPYLLTSRGLFSLADGRALQIVGGPARLWDAASIDGRLWLGGFGGIWLVREPAGALPGLPEDAAEQVCNVSADVFLLNPSRHTPGGFIFLENYSLKSLTHVEERGWVPHSLGQEIGDTPLSMVEDAKGRTWVSTVAGDIYTYSWDDGLRLMAKWSPGNGLPRDTARPRLFLADGRVVAFSDGGILALSGAESAFEPVGAFKGFMGAAAAGPFWIARHDDPGLDPLFALFKVTWTADGPSKTPLEAPGLGRIGTIASATLVPGDGKAGPVLWVAGANGMLRFDTDSILQAVPPPGLALSRSGSDDEAAPAGSNPAHAIRLSFPATSTAAEGDKVRYQFFIRRGSWNAAEAVWSAPQNAPAVEFRELAPGSYVFAARAMDRFGRAGPVAELAFKVPAPWFETWPAYIGYAVAAGLAVAAGARWRLRRLERQNESLNRLVEERTRELSLSNTAKSEFLENISHEIRNPLQGIVGLINLLDEQQLHGKSRDLAQSLKACAQGLHRAFDDVLGFSKLEYGYVSVEKRPFELRPMIDEVRGLFLGTALRQGNSLDATFPAEWRDGFEGDEAKVKTIVNNFVSNALKYAPGTPVVIAVSLLESDTGQPDVLIEVTDKGPGVPPEEQDLIFKKFVRGASAKNSKVTGTGIGLAACRALARLMGGSVGVESTLGGSTFWLRVPLRFVGGPGSVSARSIPDKADTEVGPPQGAKSHGTLRQTALIVEDQHYNRVVISGLVERLGYSTECVGDASQALSLAAKHEFPFILLDLELPGIKGPELAKRLRAMPSGASPVIVGMSAHDGRNARTRCMAAGMDAFLVKPVTSEQIRDAHAEAMSRRTAVHPVGGLDFAALELYAGKAPGGMPEAVRTYVDTLDREVSELRTAVNDRHPERMLAAVHRVHSHATIVGAARLFEAAEALESEIRAGRLPEGEDDIESVLNTAREVGKALIPLLTERAASGTGP